MRSGNRNPARDSRGRAMTPTVENLGTQIGVLPAYDHYGSNRPRCVQSKDTHTRDLPNLPDTEPTPDENHLSRKRPQGAGPRFAQLGRLTTAPLAREDNRAPSPFTVQRFEGWPYPEGSTAASG